MCDRRTDLWELFVRPRVGFPGHTTSDPPEVGPPKGAPLQDLRRREVRSELGVILEHELARLVLRRDRLHVLVHILRVHGGRRFVGRA